MTSSFVFHIVVDFFHGTFCEIFLYVRRMPEKFPYDPRMADKRPLLRYEFVLSACGLALSSRPYMRTENEARVMAYCSASTFCRLSRRNRRGTASVHSVLVSFGVVDFFSFPEVFLPPPSCSVYFSSFFLFADSMKRPRR